MKELARDAVRPGVPVHEIFTAAQQHIRNHGYPRFNRGHYGHSVGIDTFHEEPPYLSATEERLLVPGMVLALETPAYSADTGAIKIEDLVLVTTGGHELLHDLPHQLTVVGWPMTDAIALERQHSAHNYDPLPVVVAEADAAWVTDVLLIASEIHSGLPVSTSTRALVARGVA
ncbi:M24 family metallopeptidase [Saccharopolyspora phatthalungensis]|uniref:Methionine aminopeptidase n=1 Tax=Saccharopolyspora phatthalungensis TaxID=664693 RepID=A0A840QGP8_9PSEU|nr:methionine aminopeptidase [Saccharopolyspora phatthalungensis]